MESYNLVCIADETYAQHAAVMIASLFATNPSKQFRVFLMTFVMQKETKKKLEDMVNEYGSITFIENDYEGTGIQTLKSETSTKAWNPIMYLKLLIPQFLPQDVDRFLFLDVDMVVNADIEPLYEIPFSGNIVYACEDYKYLQAHKYRLGLREEDLYINSGVMMVDLKAWREKDKQFPTIECLKQYADRLNNDQDGFALYFKGEIALLPTNKWNATTFFFEQEPRILDKYLAEVDKVRRNPYIIHFCEPVKPWFKDCLHPYRNLYRKYLEMTPWKDYKYPMSGTYRGLALVKYYIKYWLNACGIRREPMSLVRL